MIVLDEAQSFFPKGWTRINEVSAGSVSAQSARSELTNAVVSQLRLLKLLRWRVLVSRGRQWAGKQTATSRQAVL